MFSVTGNTKVTLMGVPESASQTQGNACNGYFTYGYSYRDIWAPFFLYGSYNLYRLYWAGKFKNALQALPLVRDGKTTAYQGVTECVTRLEGEQKMSEKPVLTYRQAHVLNLVRHGYSTKRIAEAMGISKNTVGLHLVRANRRLNTTSRQDAAAKAKELNLI